MPSISPHPEDANFMANAECKLEVVNRQALNSPIIRLSMDVRLGKNVPYGEYGKGVHKIHSEDLPENLLLKTDQVLCSYNKTRTSVNNLIRKMHGYDTRAMPYAGEKLMGLGNVLERFVYNGQIWYSEDDNSAYTLKDSKSVTMSLIGEDGQDKRLIRTIFPQDSWFRNPNKKEVFDFLNDENIYHVDFGYACTVHKSQGSSFNKPILIDEFMNDRNFMKRLRYTGITRAVNKLIWVCD